MKKNVAKSIAKKTKKVTSTKIPAKKVLYRRLPIRSLLWFLCGGLLGLFFFFSFSLIYFKSQYENKIYPGIYINGIDFSKKSPSQLKKYFEEKNTTIQQSFIEFSDSESSATISAKTLKIGYNADLLAEQAYNLGRSSDPISNASVIFQAYTRGINLSPSYTYEDEKIRDILTPFQEKIKVDPVDAKFTFENGRVIEFNPSSDGKDVDMLLVKKKVLDTAKLLIQSGSPETIHIDIPIKVIPPKIATETVNNLGIKELLASGTSLYLGSIENRVYNLNLAASRVHGTLVKPGETFSFVKTIGDVSSFTGYKQAYVIQNGRTVLGDGGGVCQVSTTLFRAVLNAGLPVIERNPHAYRVHYYEEDSSPGIDAAVYTPTVDFKFKNDTKHSVLIQAYNDMKNYRLTFELYGTKDNREVTMTVPVITSKTPAPEPLYQDDPNLPKGQVKQIDWAAPGASVYFTRTVKKDSKVIISDKFTSHYRAWQAVYLRGTKE